MKISFVFNEARISAAGCTTQACYDTVDKLFARYGIFPTAQGVYEAPDNQNSFTAFGVAQKLPYSKWFLQTIDSWTCADEDGVPEDCLKVFYNIEARFRGF